MPKGFYERKSIKERLLNKTRKTNSCWLFEGASLRSGYGTISLNDKTVTTHRVSYEIFVGKIKKGYEVCHKCNVKSCIKPSHLYLATRKGNADDAMRDGLIKVGENHGSSKLTNSNIKFIKSFYAKGKRGRGCYEIAKIMKVHPTTIHRIVTGKTWFHERKNILL